MLVDTHLHLIDKSRLGYPWLAGEPALNRDFPYAEYARDALRAGITDVLHMEVDVAPSDIASEIEFVRGQSQETGQPDPRRHLRLPARGSRIFPPSLERALADPFVKGFRRILHICFRRASRRGRSSARTSNVCPARGSPSTSACSRASSRSRWRSPTSRPSVDLHPRPLRRARYQERRCRRLEARHLRLGRPSERHRQDFRHRRLCRQRQLDRRDAAPLCRARHRLFRLGPRRLGQRLAGLHAGRRAARLGGGDPRHACPAAATTSATACSGKTPTGSGNSG